MAEEKVILVGVDGSEASLGAVDWAVARAALHGWRVHVMCAFSLPSFTTASLDGGYTALDDSAVRSGAQSVVDDVLARYSDAPVTMTSSLEAGDPSGVLIDLSEEAAMVVVGTRGGGGFADRLLGTVSSALPAHSYCPTVVVPKHEEGAAYTPVKRIVVGVDGSPASRKALSWALGEAATWNAELTAIAAVPMASGTGALAWLPAAIDRDQVLIDVRAGLDRAVDEALAAMPEGTQVTVRRHALDGNAAELLAEFSTAVDMVVVGSRGRGGFSGLLLGSTSQAVLSHAACPVMTVPARTHHDPAPRSSTPWARA